MAFVKYHDTLVAEVVRQEGRIAQWRKQSLLVAAATCRQARSGHLSNPEAHSSSAERGGNLPITVVLPSVTHLQFLVLDLFRTTETVVPAQRLMAVLQSLGIEAEGPKFYQLTKRMEQCGLMSAEKRRVEVAGGHVQRTFYRLKPAGVEAWRTTAAIYETRRKLEAALCVGDSGADSSVR